ncbi:hypothetical protein NLG97_g4325 [Lecanicillium saksenae]|uniref:Uncharacterized protein n=1 Tax=Lecanicillium saksenae TaxID=468837 RepID=A0ACC1QYW7_9HYPO|nr:hypothetical protein NLG97_g4325 [Lecanicillium saksenae]
MEHVQKLLSLWKADKHIPDGEAMKTLLPKKDDQMKSLHEVAMRPDLVSAIKLALATLQAAWSMLEAGLCVSPDADPDFHDENLTMEELLVIAKVVPLFIPQEMGRALQPSQPSRKRKHDETALSLDDILEMDAEDGDGCEVGGSFFKSRESVDGALKGTSKPESKRRKKSESPESVILLDVKTKETGDDGDKKAGKQRKILKPKSRVTRSTSAEGAAEARVKEETED